MKIRIHLFIVLFVLLLWITKQIEVYGIFMFFILLHELGHILTGICFKEKLSCFEIMPFGFSIQFQENYHSVDGRKKKNRKKVMIALAGPAVNLGIATILLIANSSQIEWIYTNLWIAFINLLPIYPLDGGRILEALLDMKWEYKKKYNYIRRITKLTMVVVTGIGSILLFYYQNIAIFFVILYLWWRTKKRKNIPP